MSDFDFKDVTQDLKIPKGVRGPLALYQGKVIDAVSIDDGRNFQERLTRGQLQGKEYQRAINSGKCILRFENSKPERTLSDPQIEKSNPEGTKKPASLTRVHSI